MISVQERSASNHGIPVVMVLNPITEASRTSIDF